MVRVAVLGAGRIGKIHAANLAASRGARLVAVADPFGDAADALASELGCEASRDPAATIGRDDVDAVVIGTPTDTHVDLMLQAVRAGKAVLCEKPIDLDIAKTDAAVAEIERLDGRVMVAFNRRFDPSAQQLPPGHRRRRDRRGAAGGHHQPRPGAGAARIPAPFRRHLPRHGHP